MAQVIWKGGGKPQSMSIAVEVDEVGVTTVTEVLLCKDEDMATQALDFKASDIPLPLGRPFVKGSSADRVEGGMYQVTRVFTAILDEKDVGMYKLYKVTCVANREPIQTHPNFEAFAGTPETQETYGSFFDAEGNFERFLPYITGSLSGVPILGGLLPKFSVVKNRKAGVRDYLMPIIKFEETMLVLSEDLPAKVGMLGYIDTPPYSLLRPSIGNRNWLLSQAQPDWAAEGAYKLKREWSMSGPNGWDVDFYPPQG